MQHIKNPFQIFWLGCHKDDVADYAAAQVHPPSV
jgi:hypothetical protein